MKNAKRIAWYLLIGLFAAAMLIAMVILSFAIWHNDPMPIYFKIAFTLLEVMILCFMVLFFPGLDDLKYPNYLD